MDFGESHGYRWWRRRRIVSSDLDRFLEFLALQRPLQAPRFPWMPAEKILSFMATTSRPASLAQVSIHRVDGVAIGPTPPELRVRLLGPAPLRPRGGECLAVHLTRLDPPAGYQLKTRPLDGDDHALWDDDGEVVTVKGHQLFTVHHSPYTLRFFERVPFEEVRDLAASVRFALCAVGETANLSPRFVFHHEVQDGKVALFHGDGLALKTWSNLRHNLQERRLVLDLDSYRGWALRGTVEELAEGSHPAGRQKVLEGFAAGGWSPPSRCFRFVADALEEIGPVGEGAG
jgi:hypothetical protein